MIIKLHVSKWIISIFYKKANKIVKKEKITVNNYFKNKKYFEKIKFKYKL